MLTRFAAEPPATVAAQHLVKRMASRPSEGRGFGARHSTVDHVDFIYQVYRSGMFIWDVHAVILTPWFFSTAFSRDGAS